LLTVRTARAASSSARNKETFTSTAYRRSNARSEGTYPFEFHNGFWINLHHFLYEQALLRRRGGNSVQATSGLANPNGRLSTEQQQLWNTALDYYVSAMIKRDLLFDDNMKMINDRLGELEGAPDLSKSGLSADLIKILESVAPIYRARWWPQHEKANRFWVAVVTPLVQQFSRTLMFDTALSNLINAL
jgi:hypothetical protein